MFKGTRYKAQGTRKAQGSRGRTRRQVKNTRGKDSENSKGTRAL